MNTQKQLEKTFDTWLKNNTTLINNLKSEFGWCDWMEELYNTSEFEELVNSLNTNSEEEQKFSGGWTNEKDDIFMEKLSQLG